MAKSLHILQTCPVETSLRLLGYYSEARVIGYSSVIAKQYAAYRAERMGGTSRSDLVVPLTRPPTSPRHMWQHYPSPSVHAQPATFDRLTFRNCLYVGLSIEPAAITGTRLLSRNALPLTAFPANALTIVDALDAIRRLFTPCLSSKFGANLRHQWTLRKEILEETWEHVGRPILVDAIGLTEETPVQIVHDRLLDLQNEYHPGWMLYDRTGEHLIGKLDVLIDMLAYDVRRLSRTNL